MRNLPAHVSNAIKSGPIPKVRNWRRIQVKNLTRAERVMTFIESFLMVPEGEHVGKPFRLTLFQEVFLYAVYDNPHITRRALLSMARKQGKTALVAAILLAHLIGPEAVANSQIRSGARSREQAAIVFDLALKMLRSNPLLTKHYHPTPSYKSIYGLFRNVDFRALSADASTAHGLSPVLAILDEMGQIVGPRDAFVEAITTSQGAHINPLLIAISTSAPSAVDLFSVWCDDAEAADDPHTVCHVYKADDDCDLLDRSQWIKANPALGTFRSEKDLAEQLKQAARVPSMEASARNLLLNNRIAIEQQWLSPAVWKANNQAPDWDVFVKRGCYIGLDLSQKHDLTCACLAMDDEHGMIHVKPFVFAPLDGIAERSRRDRVPYDDWARSGVLIPVPGAVVNYDWVAEFLLREIEAKGITVNSVEFDRWRMNEFKAACDRHGFGSWSKWHLVGQGYKDQSPRLEQCEAALLQGKIRHGSVPPLNMAAASAIAVRDPPGNRKLDKTKTSNKIDPLVAMVMAVYPCLVKFEPFDPMAMVG